MKCETKQNNTKNLGIMVENVMENTKDRDEVMDRVTRMLVGRRTRKVDKIGDWTEENRTEWNQRIE